jgi:Beta-glucosidase-related glycosidases
MNIPESPITRRTALKAAGGVAAGIALAGTAFAAPAQADGRQASAPPWLATLTPRQQAGQRVIFSYPGATPPTSLFDGIAAGEVGGVIFFGENITSLTQIAAVIADLRAAQVGSPVTTPLLFMTDQEGGLIRRLRGQEPILSEKQIGLSADPDAEATKAGAGAAAALRNVGMNLNLAPVLDVFREPGNFDDRFQRSYSSDPSVAGRLGAEFVSAQQGAGVAATAKHFPGLGAAAASENTDLGPVMLGQPLSELRAVDESAFSPAIAAGVELVMTSWALYPAIDPVYPAGLSTAIVLGELRGRLGFAGVTITDALEAGAIDAFGDSGQRALLSAQAGMDLLLCSARDLSQGQAAVDSITNALEDRTLNPGHAQQALERVQSLRNRLF